MQKNGVYDGLKTRGTTQGEIFIDIKKAVSATIVLQAGEKIKPADPLVSTDGGQTFYPVFTEEYDSEKTDYKKDAKVVHAGDVYLALADNPIANSINDKAKWSNEGKYVINGAAMITFDMEAKDKEESFKCAVAVDCEVSASSMHNFNEATRIAGFPVVLMR